MSRNLNLKYRYLKNIYYYCVWIKNERNVNLWRIRNDRFFVNKILILMTSI